MTSIRIIANNVGPIKEADIAVNNITFLSGHNMSGKSLLHKVLFHTIASRQRGYYGPQAKNVTTMRLGNELDTLLGLDDTLSHIKVFEDDTCISGTDVEFIGTMKSTDSVVYIDCPSVMGLSVRRLGDSHKHWSLLNQRLLNAPSNDSMRDLSESLQTAMGGRFFPAVSMKGMVSHLVWRSESDDLLIPATACSEGLRLLGVLQVLIDNDYFNPIKPGMFLMDCPEQLFNKDWLQLFLSTILEINKRTNARFLLTSYSDGSKSFLNVLPKEYLSNYWSHYKAVFDGNCYTYLKVH